MSSEGAPVQKACDISRIYLQQEQEVLGGVEIKQEKQQKKKNNKKNRRMMMMMMIMETGINDHKIVKHK